MFWTVGVALGSIIVWLVIAALVIRYWQLLQWIAYAIALGMPFAFGKVGSPSLFERVGLHLDEGDKWHLAQLWIAAGMNIATVEIIKGYIAARTKKIDDPLAAMTAPPAEPDQQFS